MLIIQGLFKTVCIQNYILDMFLLYYLKERYKGMKYLHLRLEELMAEHGYTKKKVCSAIDVERTNFNRYYRDEFQRIDANLILKLCEFFDCEPGELFEIREK